MADDDLIRRLYHAYNTGDSSGVPSGWGSFVDTAAKVGIWKDEESFGEFVRDALSALKSKDPKKAFRHVLKYHSTLHGSGDAARDYEGALKDKGLGGVGDAVPSPIPGSPGGDSPSDVPPPPPPSGGDSSGDTGGMSPFGGGTPPPPGDSPPGPSGGGTPPPPGDSPPGPAEGSSGDGGDRDILQKILEALLKLGGDRKPGGEDSPWWDVEYSAPVTPMGRFWERIKRTTPVGKAWKKFRGALGGKGGRRGKGGGGGIGDALEEAGGGGMLSKAGGALNIGIKFAEAVYEFGKATYAFARDLEKGIRKLAEVGPDQAAAAAQLDVHRIERDIKTAGETAGSSTSLMDSLDRFEDALRPIEVLLTNISNAVGSKLLDVLSTALEPLAAMAEALTDIGEALGLLKPDKPPVAPNWKLVEEIAKARLGAAVPKWPSPPSGPGMGPI